MLGGPGFLLLLLVASLTSALERPVRGRVPFRPGPGLALVEGDVAVPVSQGGGQARDTFVNDPSHLWSNGIVYYRFETFEWGGVEEPIFTDQQMDDIKAIFGDIKREIPCFRFVEKSSNYTGVHLIFTSMGDAQNHPAGCYSYVGRQGAVDGTPGQVINLGSPGCFSKGRLLHEILHGLGASHEHSRSDRDHFIIIHKDRVIPDKISNFEKRDSGFSYHNTPFDAASIMMYGEDFFGIDGAVTITALKPGKIRDPKTRSSMSLTDKIELGRAYSSVTRGNCFTMDNLRMYAEEADKKRERAEEGWRKAVKEKEDVEGKLAACSFPMLEEVAIRIRNSGWQRPSAIRVHARICNGNICCATDTRETRGGLLKFSRAFQNFGSCSELNKKGHQNVVLQVLKLGGNTPLRVVDVVASFGKYVYKATTHSGIIEWGVFSTAIESE